MKKAIPLSFAMIALTAVNVFCMDLDVMMPALEKAKAGIAATFVSIDKSLSGAAKELSKVDLKGEDARNILNVLCKDRPYVVDCSIIDTTGTMIVVEPAEYKKHEGSDISTQAHIVSFLKTQKPVLSGVFHSVEGIEVIDFNYPIFSDKGEFLGAVSMLVKQDALADDVLMPLVKNLACKAWMMQKDGLIIYDPDPNQVGKNIFTDELFLPFRDLVSFSKTVAGSRDGAGSYDFYSKGLENKTVVKKSAVWDTVSLYGTEWRIIIMEADKVLAVTNDMGNL
jgi:hypothetical protein